MKIKLNQRKLITFSNKNECNFLEKIFLCNPFSKSLQIPIACTCRNDVPIGHNYLQDSLNLKEQGRVTAKFYMYFQNNINMDGIALDLIYYRQNKGRQNSPPPPKKNFLFSTIKSEEGS